MSIAQAIFLAIDTDGSGALDKQEARARACARAAPRRGGIYQGEDTLFALREHICAGGVSNPML